MSYQFSKKAEKYLPSYEDCVEMCKREGDVFYETKYEIDSYKVSVFNYRLAQYTDFTKPLLHKEDVKAYEMRGLTFVFNEDGSIYKRFFLLEKFFNINQVPESMYSIVKDYKIKFVNIKEDGSIASFIQLPNGKIIGKTKVGFDNEQSNGINFIYKNNLDINRFVNYCIENDIVAIFEYVAPHNKIVLSYDCEDLILLKLRDNKTGKHLNIKDFYDKLGSIKIAPFIEDYKDLDNLIEVVAKEVDKEGYVIHAEDSDGNDFFFKLKTPWYCSIHGILTNDIYHENLLIGYILEDKIDDLLGQIPEEDIFSREKISRLTKLVNREISKKVDEANEFMKVYLEVGSRKEFAIKYHKEKNFSFVMSMVNGRDIVEEVKKWIRSITFRMMEARNWIMENDPEFQLRIGTFQSIKEKN